MSGSDVAFIKPIGVHHRDGSGQFAGALVMIDDDHVDSGIVRHCQRVMRHRAAIYGHDQARTLCAQTHQGFSRWAISLQQPIGNVMARLVSQHSQELDDERGTGRAIDVVIAEHGYRLTSHHRLGNTIGGDVHVLEFGWVGQKLAQGRRALASQIII